MRILVVGAGFAGAVAARVLAEAGHAVQVIDKRGHIAGNAFDEVDARGVRIHRYGPHLFHTSNMEVVEWLSRFTRWVPYEHKVTALLENGTHVPLPVNRRTLELVSGVALPDPAAVEAFLDRVREPIENPRNAEEYLRCRIGAELTELLFGRYTRKMWGVDLAEMDASVVRRIPIRSDDEDRYFPGDRFQAMPEAGYTAMFERILDHPGIAVALNVAFDKAMLKGHDFAFLCSPIDEHFDYCFGPLPYRSIRFRHHGLARAALTAPTTTVNFTDEGPATRTTYWTRLPNHDLGTGDEVTATVEYPCDYRDNDMERYYPVKTADGRYQTAYERYAELAKAESNIRFIGRCGTYQYLDMHQVVNQTLAVVNRWLADRAAG